MSAPRVLVTPLLLLLAGVANAKPNEDLEYREPEVKGEKKLEVGGSLEAQWHEFDNLDFRRLDEANDQAILDSDDRNGFAFSGVALDLSYQVEERTRLVVSASHRGLWGNDQIGSTNVFGGWIYFSELSATHELPSGTSILVGRQLFEIGGLPGREYELSDVLDLVRVDQKLGELGTLTVVPINVVGVMVGESDAQLVGYLGQSNPKPEALRGDHMTRRHGAILALDGITEGLDLRAYGFYTDIGAAGTGSDISYNGKLGNFSDNDWVANAGARGSFEIGPVTPFASFDQSFGIDRKELVAGDVNASGYAIMAGLVVDTRDEEAEDESGLTAEASFYRAQGPVFRQNGMQFSHGHVGMKARHAGGLIANRYLGWHPSAYVGMFGVSDDQHEPDRKSGTQVVTARLGYALPGPVAFEVGYWLFSDTGLTALNFNELDGIDPPYGYSREEFRAERRLGLLLGQEANFRARVDVTKAVSLDATAGVFLPGPFYAIPINRVAGSQLGGEDTAWALSAGTRVAF